MTAKLLTEIAQKREAIHVEIERAKNTRNFAQKKIDDAEGRIPSRACWFAISLLVMVVAWKTLDYLGAEILAARGVGIYTVGIAGALLLFTTYSLVKAVILQKMVEGSQGRGFARPDEIKDAVKSHHTAKKEPVIALKISEWEIFTYNDYLLAIEALEKKGDEKLSRKDEADIRQQLEDMVLYDDIIVGEFVFAREEKIAMIAIPILWTVIFSVIVRFVIQALH